MAKIKPANFINYIITDKDIGKKEVRVKGYRVDMPYVVGKRDVGKRVAINMNGRMK